MSITDRSSSDGSTNSKKKKMNLCTQPKDESTRLASTSSQNASTRLHIHERGPLCEARIKGSAIYSESEEDDDYGDFLKQFSKQGWPDNDEDACLWLSSGSPSPSKSCLDHDYELSGLMGFRVAYNFVDGSRVDPIEEAYLVLGDEKISDDDQMISLDSLMEDEVVNWLVTSIESEGSSYQFSNPSSNSDYASSGVFDLEDFGNDKQLFWPFDWKSDMWSESQWEFFIMSPRKSISNDERKTSPEPLRLRVHKGKMNLQEKECTKRLPFGPGSKSSRFIELKSRKGSYKDVRKMSIMPSRLRKSRKNCAKIVPLDLEDEPAEEVVSESYKPHWGEDLESNEEVPIETMLGLDEFDGHEGVDSEFNNDDFSIIAEPL